MTKIRQKAIMDKLVLKVIKQKDAGKVLNCSARTIRRRLKRYRECGLKGLTHKSRGKPGNRKKDPILKGEIVKLMRTKYVDWPPTHASEKLKEEESISVNPETLRLWMLEMGLWKKQRKRKKGRKWRERKTHVGMMVQFDGSTHSWFTGTDKKFTLLLFIDDATGRIFARFYDVESHANVSDISIRYFKEFGLPVAIYLDRHSIYKVNLNNEEGDKISQYHRALCDLGVNLIHANSPQAKGRVERSFDTHQKRLLRELELRNIKTMDDANRYLQDVYIPKHNEKFAVPPQEKEDLHMPLPANVKLENIFTVTSERKVRNDWTIRYNNQILQIENDRPATVKPKDTVVVHKRLDKSLFISIRKQKLDFRKVNNYVKAENPRNDKIVNQQGYKPPKDHPWRQYRETSNYV